MASDKLKNPYRDPDNPSQARAEQAWDECAAAILAALREPDEELLAAVAGLQFRDLSGEARLLRIADVLSARVGGEA